MAHLRPSSGTVIKVATILFAACAALCAQSPVPDPDGAAKLLSFTGQISVLRGNYAWALNSGDAIKPLEVVVTGPDGYGIFEVADGSKFEVFPNSKVVFRANRGDWRDLLEVMLGKIRVQIEHFGGLPNNNKVRTPTAVISVRGTIFVVEVDPDTKTRSGKPFSIRAESCRKWRRPHATLSIRWPSADTVPAVQLLRAGGALPCLATRAAAGLRERPRLHRTRLPRHRRIKGTGSATRR